MITYPIVLKFQPECEDVLHRFQVDEGVQKEMASPLAYEKNTP